MFEECQLGIITAIKTIWCPLNHPEAFL